MELVIEQPVQKLLPFFRRQLRALVHRIGGGVPVGDEDAALLVESPPVGFVARVAVYRIKARCCVCVHVVGSRAELSGQIHPDQCARIAGIVREGDLPHRPALGGQCCSQTLGLGGLAAAVQPFQHDEFSVAHTGSPFKAAYCARTSAALPQHILPSGQGPETHAGPAVRKRWGATG